MRGAWLLAACLLVAGCTDGPGAEGTDDARDATPPGGNGAGDGNATGQGGGNATGNATAEPGNATSDPGNETEDPGNVTEAAQPTVQIVDESFTGTLPVDGALEGHHTFTMPPGGTKVAFVYTSEYVGLFSAVAELVDATGTTVFYTLDDCSIALAPGAETYTCALESEMALAPGDWEAFVYYQLGQVVESYTLDIDAWGHA